MFELMPLPYPKTALEPAISAETLKYHHGKHHAGYVQKLNDLCSTKGDTRLTVEDVIEAARKKQDQKLFNQAAQVWNHGFFWHSLSPEKTAPNGALKEAISESFGGLADFNMLFAEAATGHFGSGWTWLLKTADQLTIESTSDAETFVGTKYMPLLVLDVWEHAYYLDHQNDRAGYVKEVIAKLLNWEFASENFERGSVWNYPC